MISYRLPKRFKAYCSSAPSPASSGAPRKATSASAEVKPMETKRLGGPLHRQITRRLNLALAEQRRHAALQGALQLQDDALGGLLPHAGNALTPAAMSCECDGVGKTRPARTWKAPPSAIFGPTFAHTDELLEQQPSPPAREEAEQRDAVRRVTRKVREHLNRCLLAHGQLRPGRPRDMATA